MVPRLLPFGTQTQYGWVASSMYLSVPLGEVTSRLYAVLYVPSGSAVAVTGSVAHPLRARLATGTSSARRHAWRTIWSRWPRRGPTRRLRVDAQRPPRTAERE